jgi:4-hydroxybenzoyl-CoA thioesterase
MAGFTHEVTVTWGESDPFGLVYYPHILAWFNDAEHEIFRQIGFPIDDMIRDDRTTFVMGEVQFRFSGPASCGDRVVCTMKLREIRNRTLHWDCRAVNAETGNPITEGRSTRVYARIDSDGTLTSVNIPDGMRRALGALAV